MLLHRPEYEETELVIIKHMILCKGMRGYQMFVGVCRYPTNLYYDQVYRREGLDLDLDGSRVFVKGSYLEVHHDVKPAPSITFYHVGWLFYDTSY